MQDRVERAMRGGRWLAGEGNHPSIITDHSICKHQPRGVVGCIEEGSKQTTARPTRLTPTNPTKAGPGQK